MFICLHNVSEYQFCKSCQFVSSPMQPEIEAPCDKSESMRTIEKNARDKYLIMMWMEIHNFEKHCTAYNFKCHFHITLHQSGLYKMIFMTTMNIEEINSQVTLFSDIRYSETIFC